MIQPRQYQIDACDATDRFMSRGYGNPLVVAPTGAGKSMMIAMYCARAVTTWPDTRCLVLAHVKELIEQNAAAYGLVAQTAAYGICSASLGRKSYTDPVVFSQVQTCYQDANRFGYIDFAIIDECHLVNPKCMGRYRTLLDGLRAINPKLKVIGYTATPYRLGHGYIDAGETKVFDGVAYDIRIEDLIADGFLVPPVCRGGAVHADMAKVRMSNGEYVASEAAAAFEPLTMAAVADILQRAIGRKSILVFACNLKHAASVADAFRTLGEALVAVVDGETHKAERAALVARIRSGELRVLVNVGVFTTGFDAKNIDTVALLRATLSASLYVQMVGRGLRPFEGKTDCLVLDYGENVKRHGPINMVKPRKPGQKRDSDEVLARDCPKCQALIAIAARICPHCGFEIPDREFVPHHGTQAGEAEILAAADRVPTWRDVLESRYSRHVPNRVGAMASMRVDYRLGVADWASEWICPEHGGIAASKACRWMEARGYGILTVDQAVGVAWPQPRRILVEKDANGRLNVLDYEFDPRWLVADAPAQLATA